MRIGIIGGKGAGKTDLAKFIHKEYRDFQIVDGYVDRLSARLDTAFGPYATHLGNVQIATERLNCELEAGGDNFITCGTLIETTCYDALYGLSHSDSRVERAKIAVTMEFFGMMMTETYLYDRLFYLPSEDNTLDQQIEYALRLYKMDPQRIEDGKYDGVIEGLKEWEKLVDEATKAE